jgi:hypothetical protein
LRELTAPSKPSRSSRQARLKGKSRSRHPATHPVPRTPGDLLSHQCLQHRIAQDGEIRHWRFERNWATKLDFRARKQTINDAQTALRAALVGPRIADILDALAEPFLDQLVRVLANWSPSFEGAYLYDRRQQQPPAASRAFFDMVRAEPTSSQRSLKYVV